MKITKKESSKNNEIQLGCENNVEKPDVFRTKDQLDVDRNDDVWVLSPTMKKGHTCDVSWIRNGTLSDEEERIILDVFQFCAERYSCSTIQGLNTLRIHFSKGIPSITELKILWTSLGIGAKKSVNSFFRNALDIGYEEFSDNHGFTSKNLPKSKSSVNITDPLKGALTPFEYGSFIEQVQTLSRTSQWPSDDVLGAFRNKKGLLSMRVLAMELCVSLVRRPQQIAILKWCDLKPLGYRYEGAISSKGTLGSKQFQIRVFQIKKVEGAGDRDLPELEAIALHEGLSLRLAEYKECLFKGLQDFLGEKKIKCNKSQLISLMESMPIFFTPAFWNLDVDSLDEVERLFSPNTTSYHSSTSQFRFFENLNVASERQEKCKVNSNRLRHTVLTRGAQDGLNTYELAMITGVTDSAIRHYIDLDYSARRVIDTKYIGNDLLERIFSTQVEDLNSRGEPVFSGFERVGFLNDDNSCSSCRSKLAKPMGCYGCFNFHPILEADHGEVLASAKLKLMSNKNFSVGPKSLRAIEKIEQQIGFIELTISICEKEKKKRVLLIDE